MCPAVDTSTTTVAYSSHEVNVTLLEAIEASPVLDN